MSVSLLAKIEHTPRKLLYFVNRPNARSSNRAKIVLSRSFFLFKNINLGHQFLLKNFFLNSNFQTFYFLKLCPIFVNSALGLFTKYNNFLAKGQLISKANCQAVNFSKIRFYYYASGFLEEIEDTQKKAFGN